jgi:tRNA isopentenyl-2-thiomethyl-A-37 hydroxylase MiaE
MTELIDISDLRPAEMDLSGSVFCIKCAALPLLLSCTSFSVLPLYLPYMIAQFYHRIFRVQVRSFTAVPSLHDCATLPPYLPCRSAQFYVCIFHVHVRSFTETLMSLVGHKRDIAVLADNTVNLRTSS